MSINLSINPTDLLEEAGKSLDQAKSLLAVLENQGIIKGIWQAIDAAVDQINEVSSAICELDPEPEGEPSVPTDGATPPPVVEPTPPVVVEPTPPVVIEPAPPIVIEPTPPIVIEPTPPIVVQPTPPVVEPTPPVVEPTPPVVEPTPPVVAPTPPVAQPMKYAPAVKPIAGKYKLYSIGLDWKNKQGPDLSKVAASGRGTENRYRALSGGQFNFTSIPRKVKVNYDYKASNLPAAEAQAKKEVTGGKPSPNTIFAIVNSGVKGFSNAGGDTAHLYGTLLRDWLHEVGHLRPFRLGHSGVIDKDGKLKAYNDGTSFMSKFSSVNLTASQLYFLGWLPQKKVALHQITDPAMTYKVENLNAKLAGDSVQAVMIPTAGRPLFLSVPKVGNSYTPALHLSTGGGSQRVTVFGDKTEYNNLTFQKIADSKAYKTIRISPKTTPSATATASAGAKR